MEIVRCKTKCSELSAFKKSIQECMSVCPKEVHQTMAKVARDTHMSAHLLYIIYNILIGTIAVLSFIIIMKIKLIIQRNFARN